MPKKYHITAKPTSLGFDYIFKFKIVRGENCINCGKCIKVCIYEAHKRRADDPRQMAEPNTVVCRNCFRCIQECPRGALEKSLDRDFVCTGGGFWKPDMLLSLWKQAGDGKVPVSGAGYRGPFSGPGFDSMWTDMSEIVRPTRDGIHGREYISTAVELGRKASNLEFDAEGKVTSKPLETMELPLPILFELPELELTDNILEAVLEAAAAVGTLVLVPAAKASMWLKQYADNLVPSLEYSEIEQYEAVLKRARMVAIEYSPNMLTDFQGLKLKIKTLGSAITIVRVPATRGAEEIVSHLSANGAEVVELVSDYRGRDPQSEGEDARLLKDTIRAVHLRLVSESIRDEVTIVASGGIAMAEHVVKAMLCGADLAGVDIPLMVALGARVYEDPERIEFPREIAAVQVSTLTQRLVNLMAAWHLQILEMMGAMGIREARRLRGESGRAIFFEDIERETFGRLFKNR
jgi:ferredoxin